VHIKRASQSGFLSHCKAAPPSPDWVAWSTLQAACLCQLSVWSVISEEHTAPALELLEASRNEDGTLIPLTTDQKALNIRIRLDNNAAAERFDKIRLSE
jgi:hypothetical protein